jgi:hypothetical protein
MSLKTASVTLDTDPPYLSDTVGKTGVPEAFNFLRRCSEAASPSW